MLWQAAFFATLALFGLVLAQAAAPQLASTAPGGGIASCAASTCDNGEICAVAACENGPLDAIALSQSHGCRIDQMSCPCGDSEQRGAPFEQWVTLNELMGSYEFGSTRHACAELARTYFEINSIAFDWSGGVDLAFIDCPERPSGWGNVAWVTIDGDKANAVLLGTGLIHETVEFVPLQGCLLFPLGAFVSALDALVTVELAVGVYVQECFMRSEPVVHVEHAQLITRGYRMHDFQCSGVVDLIDWAHLVDCLSGIRANLDPGCERFDTDRDGDIDLTDMAGFQREFD